MCSEKLRRRIHFLFHWWGPWGTVYRGNVLTKKDTLLGEMIIQARTCRICNLERRKTTKNTVHDL